MLAAARTFSVMVGPPAASAAAGLPSAATSAATIRSRFMVVSLGFGGRVRRQPASARRRQRAVIGARARGRCPGGALRRDVLIEPEEVGGVVAALERHQPLVGRFAVGGAQPLVAG